MSSRKRHRSAITGDADDDKKLNEFEFRYEPQVKRQKLMINHIQKSLQNLNISNNLNQAAQFEQKQIDNDYNIFCSNLLKSCVLQDMEKDKQSFNASDDVVIYKPKFIENKILCYGKGTIIIRNTLKKCGFVYSPRDCSWFININWYINDYNLFIKNEITNICMKNNLKINMFDPNYLKLQNNIMYKSINVFIYHDDQNNNIIIKNKINQQYMIDLLEKHKYKAISYSDCDAINYENNWNIYTKTGKLYNGHIETWKEYAVIYQFVIGFKDNIIPKCNHCNNQLSIRKVKKISKFKNRRFYNCSYCWKVHKKRTDSFLWADGDIPNKTDISKVINDDLTQCLSQLHV